MGGLGGHHTVSMYFTSPHAVRRATCCTPHRRVLRNVCRMTCSVCKSLSNVFYISGDDCYLVSLNFFQQGSITIKVTRISFSKTQDRQDIILLPLTDIEFTTRRVNELLCLPLKIMFVNFPL